jgi:hypothetical protein
MSSQPTHRTHEPPTVAELAALSDEQLIERHDALVARSRVTGDPVTDIYLGELGRRLAELRLERALRRGLAAVLASGLVLWITLVALAIAL